MAKISDTPTAVSEFLAGTRGPEVLPTILAHHIEGRRPIGPAALSELYRKEIVTPTASQARYTMLAAALSDWIVEDLGRKLARVTQVGRARYLMLSTSRTMMDGTQATAVTPERLMEQLPRVVAKIKAGDLTRFVNLLDTIHVYGQCLACNATPGFRLSVPADQMTPMGLILETEPVEGKVLSAFLDALKVLPPWAGVVGFCTREQCTPVCGDCQQMVPTRLDPRWIAAQLEDKMCWACASRQLVNVRRPQPGRIEQRKLGRLIIQ